MILFFDTETTGLYPGKICQLSYIMRRGDDVIPKNFFFAVDYVEPSAFRVHGLSPEKLYFLSEGRTFSDHIDEIEKDFNSADVVVAHNAAFDTAFMSAEFDALGREFNPKHTFCSMKKSVPECKIYRSGGRGYKYPKLSEMCEHFGVERDYAMNIASVLFGKSSGFHDARFDTVCLFLAVSFGMDKADCFSELKNYLNI